MDIHTIIATYQQTIQQGREKLSKVKNKIYRIGSLKLLLFVACIAGIIYFVSAGWTTILGVIAITLIPFLVLVKYHNRLFNEKDYLEKEIEVNEQELPQSITTIPVSTEERNISIQPTYTHST